MRFSLPNANDTSSNQSPIRLQAKIVLSLSYFRLQKIWICLILRFLTIIVCFCVKCSRCSHVKRQPSFVVRLDGDEVVDASYKGGEDGVLFLSAATLRAMLVVAIVFWKVDVWCVLVSKFGYRTVSEFLDNSKLFLKLRLQRIQVLDGYYDGGDFEIIRLPVANTFFPGMYDWCVREVQWIPILNFGHLLGFFNYLISWMG